MISAKALPHQLNFLDSKDGSGVQRPSRELVVITAFREQHLASREIEEQTRVMYLHQKLCLWVVVKSLVEGCFFAWAQITEQRQDVYARKAGDVRARFVRELDAAVLAAYENPLDLKAVARVTQLGINAHRTLDICLEALLGYPSQKSVGAEVSRPLVRIDWALGGLSEWAQAYPFAFEQGMAPFEFSKNSAFYTTEKNGRKDITAKQIANIFCVHEHVIESLEARALRQIRKSVRGPDADALKEFAMDFLADE